MLCQLVPLWTASNNRNATGGKRDIFLILFVILCSLSLVLGEVAPVDPDNEPNHGGQSSGSSKDIPKPQTGSAQEVVKSQKINESSNGSSSPFMHGFIATLSVIIVSELGDKTFFIAAIMAMKHPRATVFVGAMSALAVMHVMSSFFGYAITVIPRAFTYYISSFLFAVFGIKMLKEGYYMSPNEAQEEFDEVQEDLMKREKDEDLDTAEGGGRTGGGAKKQLTVFAFVSRILIQAFTMTFLAEWGDRSQLATIVLAAREDVAAVVVGGLLGHALCTGLAVLGGRMIAQRISVRTVTLVGGVVFILFALSAFVIDPNDV